MRISEELEKSLLVLEDKTKDNNVSLLDFIKAYELTYNCINKTILKDEKGFVLEETLFDCVKEKYDAVKGKTIYSVSKSKSNEILFNIEVSNIGEVSFDIISQDNEIVDEAIEMFNNSEKKLLDQLKMNAEVSLYTQNRELVLSENPYIAIKMGNFNEQAEATLVYKEENKNQINITNKGLKYIDVKQISNYLKNINVDEKMIPTLTYAFLGHDNTNAIKEANHYTYQSTYPYLTPEKVEKLKDEFETSNKLELMLTVGVAGSISSAIFGGIIASLTGIPILAGIIGLPVIFAGSTGGVLARKIVNINRAYEKEELLEKAHLDLYEIFKVHASKNMQTLEEKIIKKRDKKVPNLNIDNKNDVISFVRKLKNNLRQSVANKGCVILYGALLNQILNIYTSNQESKEQQIKDDIYGELLRINDDVYDLEFTNVSEVISNGIDFMKRLIDKGDTNTTIENLNLFVDGYYEFSYSSREESQNIPILRKLYFETMLTSLANGEQLSVQTLATIKPIFLTKLLVYTEEFALRLKHFDDNKKYLVATKILNTINSENPQSVKLFKIMNSINDNELSFDFIGKEISKEKAKVKIKEES